MYSLKIGCTAVAMLLSVALSGQSYGQEIEKCQDEEGNWHYGNFAAQECARDSNVTKLNEGGDVVGVEEPPMTQEEIEQEERAKTETETAQKQRQEQRERDRNLIQVYGSEELILSVRDRQLHSISNNIEVTKQLRQGILSDLEALKNREKTEEVETLIKEREHAVASYDEAIQRDEAEHARVEKKYVDILEEFHGATDRLAKDNY